MNQQNWDEICQQLRTLLPSPVYSSYLDQARLEPSDEAEISLNFPDSFTRDGFEEKCRPFVDKIQDELERVRFLEPSFTVRVYHRSAHKEARELLDLLDALKGITRVYVTVAGLTNALSGVVAGYTRVPVIACPNLKDAADLQNNINSSLICPRNVPVQTVLHPVNVAEAVRRILRAQSRT